MFILGILIGMFLGVALVSAALKNCNDESLNKFYDSIKKAREKKNDS